MYINILNILQSYWLIILTVTIGVFLIAFAYYIKNRLVDFVLLPRDFEARHDALVQLYKEIEDKFNDEEVDELCFELNVDDENLKRSVKKEKTRELVKYLDRRGRVHELVSLCEKKRDDGKWLPIKTTTANHGSGLARLPWIIGVCGGILLLIGALSFFFRKAEPISVSLLSISYMHGDYDPHIIDLRTADTIGISVGENTSLRFFGAWLETPEKLPEGYSARLKVFDNPGLNDGLIGETALIPLEGGKVGPLDFDVKSLEHGETANAWNVQGNWLDNSLYLVLETYFNDKRINQIATPILLVENSGYAWMTDTPVGSFTSIIYSINDGPQQFLDIAGASSSGLSAGPGDILTIHEVWYHARKSESYNEATEGHLSAYITAGGYDISTECTSEYVPLHEGIHALELEAMYGYCQEQNQLRWEIPDNKRQLIISLSRRENRPILDRLVLELTGDSGNQGLIPANEALRYPFDEITYIDFETPEEVDGWTGNEDVPISEVGWSAKEAFTNQHALAVTTTGTLTDSVLAIWYFPIDANQVSGRIYWPRQEGVSVIWAHICIVGVGNCDAIPVTPNQWNAFYVDLFNMPGFVGDSLAEDGISGLFIQAGINVNQDNSPYTFYIDGIEIYPTE